MRIVMIADDSPVIRKVGRRLLEDMGFVVVDAVDGNQAIEVCRDNMPDIIVMDRSMPGPDSVDLIREITMLPGGDDTKILYCLSEVMVAEMTKAKRAGAAGFLMKPFDRAVLEEKLAEAGIEAREQAA